MSSLAIATRGFIERLDAVGSDARQCAASAYAGSALIAIADGSKELRIRLDLHAGFWNVALSSMQTAALAAMGRIYDNGSNVYSARKLLEWAQTYPGIFAHDEIRARVHHRGLGAQEAESYASEAYKPIASDFNPLQAALADWTKLYQKQIEPIRHRVVAHRGQITREELTGLFANVPRSDYERLAALPLQLHEILWQLFHNGTKPELAAMPVAVGEILTKPLGKRTTGYEHQYVTRDASAFAQWLESRPV